MDLNLSKAEKIYLIHGVEDGVREDGRSSDDYRSIELELNVVPNANGSSRIKLGKADILAGVKCEISEPEAGRPNEGIISFSIDCSANAGTEWEGRGGDDVAVEISQLLHHAFNNARCLDLKSLCLIPGEQCWHLFIDILILEYGGNVLDAVSIAVKSALYDCEIPKVLIKMSDKGSSEIELSDNPSDFLTVNVDFCPIFVTVNKLGRSYVIDTTLKEEACCMTKIVAAVTKDGLLTASQKKSTGSLQFNSLLEMFDTAKKVGKTLNEVLIEKLKEAKLSPNVGFMS